MKFCIKCGNRLTDEAKFCTACGAKSAPLMPPRNAQPQYAGPVYYVPTPVVPQPAAIDPEVEQELLFLNSYNDLVNDQRRFWKIFGIILFSIGMFFGFILSVMLLTYLTGDIEEASQWSDIIECTFITAALTTPGIVGMTISSKLDDYQKDIYNDFAQSSEKIATVSKIILGAFFNSIAMIFAIILFVKTKSNKDLIDKITEKQKNGIRNDIV